MYASVKGYIENLSDYFPDYEHDYVPPRKYFWNIFSTLNQELAEKCLDHVIKERNKTKGNSREQNWNISRDNGTNQ